MHAPLRHLWIDGVEHTVPHPVWAHMQTMMDTTRHLAKRIKELPLKDRLRLDLDRAEETGRWNPEAKRAVIVLVWLGDLDREETLAKYEISDEEMGRWELAFAERGMDGLKVGLIQAA